MTHLYTVCVGMRVLASTLEILATNHAGIDVVVAKRHGAQFLKVKVEDRAVNGVKERTTPTQWVLFLSLLYSCTFPGNQQIVVTGARSFIVFLFVLSVRHQ
jgi:hypothetical protein